MNLYYDQGWIAYVQGQKFDPDATIDWKDGYNDAQECENTMGRDYLITATDSL